jgi:hypothetical protein
VVWWKETALRWFGGIIFKRKVNQFLQSQGLKGKELVGMLSGYKTYITAGLAVLAAVGAALTGDVEWGETLNKVWGVLMPLGLVFLRKGVSSGTT